MKRVLFVLIAVMAVSVAVACAGGVEIIEANWWDDSPGWVAVAGTVKNTSDHTLRIQFVVHYKDADGDIVGYEKNYVDIHRLPPGHISTFGTKTKVTGEAVSLDILTFGEEVR